MLLKLNHLDSKGIQENKNSEFLCPHSKDKKISSLSLAPGKKLRFEMQVLKKDSQAYKSYINYCLLTFMLAGFGQRSRRGGGSVQLDDFNWNNVSAFRKALQETLQSLHLEQNFNYNPQQSSCLLERNVTENTYPRLMRVWIGEAFKLAEQACYKISESGHLANPGNSPQMLGSVHGGRLSSPLLCTVRHIGVSRYPLVSEMSNPHMNKASYQVQRDLFLRNLGVSI